MSACPEARVIKLVRRAIVLLGLAVAVVVFAGCGSGEDDSREAVAAEPSAGRWKPWVLSSASDVKVGPPPAAGSAKARAELAELRKLAAADKGETAGRLRRWSAEPAMGPWLEFTLELQEDESKNPPAASRAYGLLGVAMYDAVVAAWHWKYQYKREPPEHGALVEEGSDPSYPSEHAAIAGAASRVLEYAYPEYPAERIERMAEEAAESRVRAGANYRSDVEAGLALGRAVAADVIAHARQDGSGREWDGRRPRGRAYWEPPPGSSARPVAPLAGTWRTWVLRSGSQVRPEPPPKFGSRKFLAEAREVMEVERKLTPAQKRVADFWAGAGSSLPPGIWNQVAVTYLQQAPQSTPRAARTLALMNVALADAGVAAWDAKYAYWSPRPENAIRELGLDRRWEPYLATPFFPSYVSGHATYSGAAAEVLAQLFSQQEGLFRAKAREAAQSRLYGGIHFRSDNDVGLRMGQQIGRLVMERAKTDGADR